MDRKLRIPEGRKEAAVRAGDQPDQLLAADYRSCPRHGQPDDGRRLFAGHPARRVQPEVRQGRVKEGSDGSAEILHLVHAGGTGAQLGDRILRHLVGASEVSRTR